VETARDRQTQRAQAAAAIRSAETIVMSCHVNADGDAIGSLCALGLACRHLGKRVLTVSPDGVPEIYDFIPGSMEVLSAAEATSRSDGQNFDVGIGVDADGSDRLGGAEALVLAARVVIDIDHHTGPPYGDLPFVDPEAAASGELVYDLINALGVGIDPQIATALMAAIVTDTGSFRYPSVTAETMRITAELIERGAHPQVVWERVYGQRSYPATLLLGRALKQVRRSAGGRLAWAALSRADFRKADAEEDETEGIINEIRVIEGTGVAILMREQPDGQVRISFRSKDGTDVASLAEQFGGGGHRAAAGATTAGPLADAEERIIAAALAALRE
jgi:bifunctional oligoribonuclease and PAP phosphatase NrnA